MYIDAIIYGCTYDEFWHDDPRIFFWKEESFLKLNRINLERMDMMAWIHGAYVLEAIGTAFSKDTQPHKYPAFPQFIETMDEELKRKRELAELMKMRDNFLAVSKKIEINSKNKR